MKKCQEKTFTGFLIYDRINILIHWHCDKFEGRRSDPVLSFGS